MMMFSPFPGCYLKRTGHTFPYRFLFPFQCRIRFPSSFQYRIRFLKKLPSVFPSLILFLILLVGSPVAGQVRINEVCSSNSTIISDPVHGDFSDWIELYNSSGIAVDLTGYFLSDDTADLFKWQLPDGATLAAGEFLLVFADDRDYGLHTSFNLNKMGEYVLLSSAAAGIVDSIRVPFLLNDMSYGRLPAEPALLSVFETPTPGVVNIGTAPQHIAALPQFSKPGGFYDGPLKIGLSGANSATSSATAPAANSEVQIYYTLDGTYPTTNANLYTDSLEITATTVIRAIAVEPGAIPGIPVTQTYFINEPQNLPVFSMVTDPDHLFSDESGIMVQGTNGVPGYCTDIPHNLSQDWERPVNIEFYETGSQQVINQMCGTKIFGGCSRIRYPQKSLAFYARSDYEYSSFKYQMFPSKPASDYETFILRAGADDQPHTFFRDPLTHMLVQDVVDVDMQAYRPVVLYINGEYYGIINLREKTNEHYVNDNYGIDADSVDLLKRNGEGSWNVVAGSNDEYIEMMDFVRGNDLSLPANYAYMTTKIDIDEYINYQVIQVYLGARDWPGNNIKYWKSSVEPYTKWRWILYDLDHHFNEFFGDIMEESTEEDCGCDWPNPPWSTLLFRSMLENETFRDKFIGRFNLLSGTVFDRERMHEMVDQLQADLLPEIPRHIERWGGQKVTHIESTWMSPAFNSIEEWNAKVQVMHDFIDSRHEVAMQQMHEYFGVNEEGTQHLSVALADPISSTLLVDKTPVVEGAFSGNFTYAAQLPLEVVPKAGFLFSHWDRVSFAPEDSMVITFGDEWRYDDSGQWPDAAWKDPGFDDSNWNTGVAELGYGDGDETTVVSYGQDPDNKHITTRFRKTFDVGNAPEFKTWEMRYKRDDGISVYLNGTEIIRDNQNRYYVGNDTPAEVTVSGEEENRLLFFNVNPALFVNGENTIAAEVHQVDTTSSDISFDLQLQATRLVPLDTQQVEGANIGLELLQDLHLVAHVKTDTMWRKRLFINEIQTANIDKYADEAGDFDDWIELYNTSAEAVDVGGLYLSDTLPATRPWRFPLNRPALTIIAPDSFLVVFADNEPQEGPLHADFRLNNDGEEVVLLHIMDNDTTIFDHVIYGEQYNNVTYGRYPDGSDHFEFMPVNTPWMSNFWEPLDTTSVDESVAGISLKIYPNPSDGRFFVLLDVSGVYGTGSDRSGVKNSDMQPVREGQARFSAPDPEAQFSVYTITGRKVYSEQHRVADRVEISIADQPAGIYLLEVVAGGWRYVERVVVR
jgi:hypothetical protein